MSDNSLPPMRSVAAARLANDLIAGSVKSPDWPENVLSRQAKSAAMDALIADSADMIAPVGEVERVAKALAGADGLDWDEVCGVDAAPDEGYCDSGTCVAAHWEEHDAEQARRWYMHLATAALSAMSPAGEAEQRGYDRAIAEVVAWLREQHDGRLVSRIYLASAIEAGEHKP